MSVNRNKKSLTLNLKAPEGQAILQKLRRARATWCWRTSAPAPWSKLGFGYEALARSAIRSSSTARSRASASRARRRIARRATTSIVQARVGRHGHHRLRGRPAGEGGQLDRRPRGRHVGRARHHAGAAARASGPGAGRRSRSRMLDVMAVAAHLPGRASTSERGRPPRAPRQRAPVHRALRGLQGADAYLTLGVANNSLWDARAARPWSARISRRIRASTPRPTACRTARRWCRSSTRSSARARPTSGSKRFDAAGVPAGRIKYGGRGVRERASQGAGHDRLAAASRRRARSR